MSFEILSVLQFLAFFVQFPTMTSDYLVKVCKAKCKVGEFYGTTKNPFAESWAQTIVMLNHWPKNPYAESLAWKIPG